LILNGPLDNHYINTLEQKLEKTQIKRVDSDTADKLIDKDQKVESVSKRFRKGTGKDRV
jgi:molecular chaperone HtpG